MESNTSSRKVQLKSSDGDEFWVNEEAAKLSQTISHMIEDDCAKDAIPIPNVTGKILAKVIEYCIEHSKEESKKSDEQLKKWDSEFLDVDQRTLFDLMKAANFLVIKGLLDLTARKTANMIKGKSTEEIRSIFHLRNDFSPEEEVEIRSKNQWAFD